MTGRDFVMSFAKDPETSRVTLTLMLGLSGSDL